MANEGFNLKIRKVENGYTIHLTEVPEDFGNHKNFVAQSKLDVEGTLEDIISVQLDKLESGKY